MSIETSKKTPLYEAHVAAGARMIEFGGWAMPVQYEGITAEHSAVRSHAGLFDISHMGQVEVAGPDAAAFLDYLLPNAVRRLSPGRIAYSPMCNPAGGVIDDLLVYRRGENSFLLVVNAARTDADFAWIVEQASRSSGLTVRDASPDWAMLALQGPDAEAILSPHTSILVSAMRYYRFSEGPVAGAPSIVSRTGYTGEDGFELMVPPAEARRLWDLLLKEVEGRRAVPAGLGARDVLRLEMGYALYGSDLSEEVTPLEAGLDWTVRFDKPGDFVGRAALEAQRRSGVRRLLIGLRLTERGIPRSHQRVLSAGGEPVGEVTSGTFSPSLQCGIALGHLEATHAEPGGTALVEIRQERKAAQVVRPPFVEPGVRKGRA